MSKATNQHGVHSPFIYGYVTKCLYTNKKYNGSKSLNVLLKSIAYFNVERVILKDGKTNVQSTIKEDFPDIKFVSDGADVIYLSKKYISEAKDFLSKEMFVHNNTMLFVDAIYESKQTEAIWEALKLHPKVTVTVDMFYCGAVFFRREQAEEHFKIRI